MSVQQATNILKDTAVAYKIAIVWFFLFSFNALMSAIMLAFANVEWCTLDRQGKFLIFVAVGMNWSNTIMAFMVSQIKRIEKTGSLLPLDDDNDVTTKTTGQVTQVTTVTPKPPTTE